MMYVLGLIAVFAVGFLIGAVWVSRLVADTYDKALERVVSQTAPPKEFSLGVFSGLLNKNGVYDLWINDTSANN